MSDYIKIYVYARGTDWSVKCIAHGPTNITYAEIIKPEGADKDLLTKFLDEAEAAVQKQLSIQEEKRYT